MTKIVRRKEWMFRLVGDEIFDIDKVQCIIKVEPDGLFMYTYSLLVNGKSLEEFCEQFSKTRSSWVVTTAENVEKRITLGNIINIFNNNTCTVFYVYFY